MTVGRALLLVLISSFLWGCDSELTDDELISSARTGFENNFQDFYRKQFGDDVHVLQLPKHNLNRNQISRSPNGSFVVLLSYGSKAIDNYWEIKIELDQKGEISKVEIDIQGFI